MFSLSENSRNIIVLKCFLFLTFLEYYSPGMFSLSDIFGVVLKCFLFLKIHGIILECFLFFENSWNTF